MDVMQQEIIFSAQHKKSPYSAIRYLGIFTPDAIKPILGNFKKKFDAIAVPSYYRYGGVLETIMENYNGPLILVHSNHDNYDPPPNRDIIHIELPFKVSEFDALIEKYFKKL